MNSHLIFAILLIFSFNQRMGMRMADFILKVSLLLLRFKNSGAMEYLFSLWKIALKKFRQRSKLPARESINLPKQTNLPNKRFNQFLFSGL